MKTTNWRRKLIAAAVVASTLGATATNAATWDITVTNLTHGNHFTPLYLSAHDTNSHLFQVGQTAANYPGLELMAECGALSGLPPANGTSIVANPVPGALAPGANTGTKISISTAASGETLLSVVAMILPTNDAFIGLDAQLIPTAAGTYTYYLNGYDAGTEINDEILNTSGCDTTTVGMPAAPNGDADSAATGVTTTETNTNIHVHRGVLGEASANNSGTSDLVNSIHRWQNPVAKVVVTVTP